MQEQLAIVKYCGQCGEQYLGFHGDEDMCPCCLGLDQEQSKYLEPEKELYFD